ncbi:biotin/lipoyl-containing protein, partial [Methylacidimicrobium cyclopophantes]|uniref:biotin/lipoyl-containing protein n=1 Tax=Methylacidimicrobium cyclopophantes TaxID=1041766 RepID=UPI00319E3B8F
MPFLGESIRSGVLGRWLKSEGDPVEPGDALGEIETEKITSEVYAEVPGSFTPLVEPGTQVEVGQVIARIEERPGVGTEGGSTAPARDTRPSPSAAAGPVPAEAHDRAAEGDGKEEAAASPGP